MSLSEEQGILINGRYRLLDKLGEGGMAEVWRARDTALGRIVALKMLRPQYNNDPDFLARFRREAQAAANLTHPNIIRAYDIGETNGQHYIVMECVDGQDLKQLIRRQAPLPVGRALDIAIQVASAVAHAHQAGIIHRDLKPQNILVDAQGGVKVTDFGIARAMSAPSATETGVVLGTVHYLAPEQAAGRPTTPASDVYALGVVLYEMLTGRPPFDADTSVGIAMKHLQEKPLSVQQLNPRVPMSVATVVDQALAKDPEARYADAGVFANALRSLRDWGDQVTGAQPAVALPSSTAPATSDASHLGFDTMGVFLGILALVAVLGLIPLWQDVYEAYVGPLPIPELSLAPIQALISAPTAPAGEPELTLIEVPDVTGLSQIDAEDRLLRAGLQAQVRGSSPHEEIPVSHVIQSNPAAGALVGPSTIIQLIISSGPLAVEVPTINELTADQATQALQNAGLEVERLETWDPSVPAGAVISQSPPGGAHVSKGSRVTITVSSGPVIPLNANLGNQIDLVEAELSQRTLQAGDTLRLTLRWRARQTINQNYVVFVHITPADGPILTQQDSEPVDGGLPTSIWIPGQLVSDAYQLTIPGNARPGRYEIRVGMYPPGQPGLNQRLPIIDAGLAKETFNSVIVAEIEIEG